MANNEVIFLLFLSLISSATIDEAQSPIALKVSASRRGLTLGTAVGVRYLRANVDDGRYSAYLNENYQMVVPGSELMSVHIWQGENQYNFTDADWMLGATPNSTGWVQQNEFIIRGHNLVWAYDSKIPRWLLDQESSITPDKAKSLLSDYIHTVVGRYRGKIQWWDVINEAISDYNETRAYNLRDSFWYRKLGQDFIKYAFIFAHEADPRAKLFYNEYHIEH
jgi:GH35 family endo-1,4-beta-xylanase